MTKILHGIMRGKTIELAEDLGVADGQEVEVRVTVVETARQWVAGITRLAGALADDAEWDGIMEEVHRGRKLDRRPQLDEP
ncbi:MAG: hypothetical protein ACYC3X_30840 [Pirellulaceae bacterium]